MRKEKYEKIVEELRVMFGGGYGACTGTVNTQERENRALVEIRTKDVILKTHKENMYFHGALMNCDNYSLKVENDELVIIFGFEWI